MIIYWPGHTPSGAVSDEPVITHDLYPTILEMTGTEGEPSHNKNMDGTSLTSVLEDPSASLDREALYWHYPHYHRANPYSAVRAGKWRLIHFYENDRIELYNLDEDIGETNDLSEKRPKKAKQLKARLDNWRERVDAQPPRINPSYGTKVATYRFDDEDMTDDEFENYPLKKVVNGTDDLTLTGDGTLLLPGEDAAGERDYLEVDGPGGAEMWTVSFWFRTPTVDQGPKQGLFSNNKGKNKNWSWEVDVHNGTLRLRSREEGKLNPVIASDGSGAPSLKPGTWHHVVVRKTGGDGDGELYLGTKDRIEEVGTINMNPGGLQMFRVGVNRASDHLYRAELSKISVFRLPISPEKLNKAGRFGDVPVE